jgi:hypothetical protein
MIGNFRDLPNRPENIMSQKMTTQTCSIFLFQAGLYALDEPVAIQDIKDNPKKVGQIIAAQKPAWEPGKKPRYMYKKLTPSVCDPGIRLFFLPPILRDRRNLAIGSKLKHCRTVFPSILLL